MKSDAAASVELDRIAADFRRSRTIGHAGELLSASIVLERNDLAEEAARFLAEYSSIRPAGILREISGGFLHEASNVDESSLPVGDPLLGLIGESLCDFTKTSEVRRVRRELRKNPRSSIGWLDLARSYAATGANDKGERAIRVALSLAPDHRYVLRSASRFFLHIDRPDVASDLLRRSAATRDDPWLMAAEIAAAMVADRNPRMIREARSMLTTKPHSPFHLSELASAFATLEAASGASKAARKLFRQALIDPTDNAIAQAEWAGRHLRFVDFDPGLLARPRTYEANAWAAYVSEQYAQAVIHAKRWAADEPFSGRAAAIGALLCGIALEDFDAALAFARQGVRTNPEDVVLRNNLVFILAEAGLLDEADREQASLRSSISSGTANRVVWLANSGLLEYRRGKVASGAGLYAEAIAAARELSDLRLAQLAAVYWAAEEVRSSPLEVDASSMVARVSSDTRAHGTPDIRLGVVRLERINRRRRGLVGKG